LCDIFLKGKIEMDDFEEYIISFIMGITTGVIGTICSNKLHVEYEKRKRNWIKKEFNHEIYLRHVIRKE
jgi:hypothetical protein